MNATRSISFGSASAAPGEKSWGALQISEGDLSVSLSVGVIHGAKPGPHVVAMAGVHGQEMNGIAAIRAFWDSVDPSRLSGTLFAIPCANPRATMMCEYVWPEEAHHALLAEYGNGPYPQRLPTGDVHRLNMQRRWPGKIGGLLVERMTHEIWNQAVLAAHRWADLVLDMHCYHRETPGAMVVSDETMIPYGLAGGLRQVILMRDKPDTPYCTSECRRQGIPALILENSGQTCVTPDAAAEGELVLGNLMRYLRMLPGEPELPAEAVILDPWRDDDLSESDTTTSIALVRAKRSGMYIPYRQPFEFVEKGELLGRMMNLYTSEITQVVRAPRSGCLYNAGASLGVCQAGTTLAGVSIYEQVTPAEVMRQQGTTSPGSKA